MVIKVLGSGCKNCMVLADNVKIALDEAGIVAEVQKVTDIQQIISYGVMSTPAMVIDEKVVSFGKVLKPAEVVKILEKLAK
jgi:small redox-active disulfide protein 2